MIQKRNLNATEDNSVAPELEREALTRLRSGNGIYCTSTTFEEFYLIFAAKSLVSIWPKTWERAPGWLKRGLAAAERSSSEATGLQRLLVVLEGAGGPVEDQPSLGTRQPAEVGQGPPISPKSFPSSPGTWPSGKWHRRGLARAELRARRPRRAWFRLFSERTAASTASWGFLHSPGEASARPGRGHGHRAGFACYLRNCRSV